MEPAGSRIGQQRYDEVLRGSGSKDISRAAEHLLEVSCRKRHSHAEQEDPRHPANVGQDPSESVQPPEAPSGEKENVQYKKIGKKTAFFQYGSCGVACFNNVKYTVFSEKYSA
jgi:hypothetical protein